jgi:AraC-like DNA-binding protein
LDQIPRSLSEQVCWDNPAAQEIALPLFNAGIHVAAITWRKGYRSTKFNWNNIHRLMLPLQGKFELRLGRWDHKFSPKPGELVYCPPGSGYFMRTDKDVISQWLYFQIADTASWEPLRDIGPFVKPYDSATLVYVLLRRILDARESSDPQEQGMARGNANMLANVIRRLKTHSPAHTPDPQSFALRKLVHEISLSPAEDWTQKRLTERLHVSPSTLLRVCRAAYDISPRDIIIQIRMSVAANFLINTNEPLAIVAEKVGYQSVYSFSRLFSKVMDMPPGRYRTQNRHLRDAEPNYDE